MTQSGGSKLGGSNQTRPMNENLLHGESRLPEYLVPEEPLICCSAKHSLSLQGVCFSSPVTSDLIELFCFVLLRQSTNIVTGLTRKQFYLVFLFFFFRLRKKTYKKKITFLSRKLPDIL